MPEIVKLTGSGASENTPTGGPDSTPQSAPVIGQGTVSEEEALKGAEHTKIATLTPGFGGPVSSVQPGNSVQVAGLVDAKLAVELMDATLPSLMVFLLYKVGMKLRRSDLQLTEKEKSTLAPIVQKCLEQMMINFNNPWVALSVSILFIYGSKIVEKGMPQLWDKKQQKQESEALKEKAAAQGTPIPEAKTAVPVEDQPPAYEPSDAEIRAKMKAHKYGYEQARTFLINLHKKAWKDAQRRIRRQAA